MKPAAHQLVDEDKEVASLSTRLAAWYDANASIRRLWAIENGRCLTVCVALEPTADGSDSLPLWLAMNREWNSDLEAIIPREIQLKLVASDMLPPSCIADDAVIVAEVDWRESWIHS